MPEREIKFKCMECKFTSDFTCLHVGNALHISCLVLEQPDVGRAGGMHIMTRS